MAKRHYLIAIALLASLGGCGTGFLAPFDAEPRAPPKGASEEFTRVGICYNRETTTPQEIAALARANCGPGTTPHLIGQDFLASCPLLTPMRATFACLKPGAAPPAR